MNYSKVFKVINKKKNFFVYVCVRARACART